MKQRTISNRTGGGAGQRTLIVLFAFCVWIAVALPAAGAQRNQAEPSWAERTLASMSLDEKIGQLIIPAAVGRFVGHDSEDFQRMRRDVEEFHVGGYHMLGDAAAMHEPAGVALVINQLQKLAKTPLWITADFEGGVGYRFLGATRLPRAMAMGATASEELAYEAGRVTAIEARAIGVHVNFYPVVDVNNNPANPVINIRSFGSDPRLAGRLAAAYVRGAQSAGVMATAKHFPGHGDTSVDSHLDLPVIDINRARLDAVELPPFREAIAAGAGGVMTAHIALPRLDAERLPATLSRPLLTGLLREELKFNGVVFTDAMMMRGISGRYGDGEAAVRAIAAGADVVLYPASVEAAFKGLKQAVETGQLSEARINESVRRILMAKERLGLHRERFVDLNRAFEVLGNRAHQEIARRLIERAITRERDRRGVLPLKPEAAQRIFSLTMVDDLNGWREGAPGRAFQIELEKRHKNIVTALASDRTSPGEFELLRKLAASSDIIVVNAFVRVASFKGAIGLTAAQAEFLKRLSALDKPFVTVVYGSPYLLTHVPELPACLLTYEYYPAVEEAAARALFGEIELTGRLPVNLTP